MPQLRAGVVFVHGFLSSAAVWSRFLTLMSEDGDLAGVTRHTFQYASPPFSLNPLRRIPHLNDVADGLRTFLAHDTAGADRLVLVSHSQGGLVVQRMLARTLADGRGRELARIARIVMFACPNSGSDLALLPRRWVWFRRHPQEVELRPLDDVVADTHRVVINQVIHAEAVTASTCPIRIVAYAGESDGVVTPASARSVFPEVGVLPGDHRSLVRPDSHTHRSYTALRHHLLESLTGPPVSAPAEPRPAGPARADGGGGDPSAPGPHAALVDKLLAVPRMNQTAFRDELYALLPPVIIHQLTRDPAARLELFALLRSFRHYPDQAPWEALAAALTALAPGQAAVTEVLSALEGHGLIAPRHPSD